METENNTNWKFISAILFVILILVALWVTSERLRTNNEIKLNQTIQNATINGYNYCLYQNNQYIIQSLQQSGAVVYQIVSNNQTYAVQLILNQSRKLT